MEQLRLQLRRIAPHLRIALITGEHGTCKEDIARALHALAGKEAATFTTVTTSSDFHRVRQNHAGSRRPTLFLANLSALSAREQAELLATIRSSESAQPANRRPQMIFASRDDLRGLVSAGQFDPELYARICSVEITLPPLRSRPEDLAELTNTLLATPTAPSDERLSSPRSHLEPRLELGLDPRAFARLQLHNWPGNLRELSRVIALARRHASNGLGTVACLIEAMHLPSFAATTTRQPLTQSQFESETETERLDDIIERHVLSVLLRCSGNKVRAAERLGISRSTLYRMLEGSATAASIATDRPFVNGHAPFANGRAQFANGHSQIADEAAPTLHH